MIEKNINPEKICKDVISISKETSQWIMQEMQELNSEDIETKGLHNFVTYIDKGAEERLVEKLGKLLHGASFLAEEETVSRNNNDYEWIVDPLDGTTNFIHGVPCFSISIALSYKGKTILGMVHEINRDEVFYSWEGSKAYLNDKEISVSSSSKLEDTLFSTGFPYNDYTNLDKYLELFVYCLRNTHGIRRFGSAAVDLAYVACGRYDGFFEYTLNPWDVAAGAFLVKQAGGQVADFSGGNNFLFGKEIIATNDLIYDTFIKIVKDTLL